MSLFEDCAWEDGVFLHVCHSFWSLFFKVSDLWLLGSWDWDRISTIKMSFCYLWLWRFLQLTFRLCGYSSLKHCFVLLWLFILIELGTSVRLIGVVIVASLLSMCVAFFIQTSMSYLCFDRVTNLLNESLHAYVSEEKSKRSAKQVHPGSSKFKYIPPLVRTDCSPPLSKLQFRIILLSQDVDEIYQQLFQSVDSVGGAVYKNHPA